MRRILLLPLLFSACLANWTSAQDNPLGQPLLDINGNLREEAFIRIPLREDDLRYADIDGAWMKQVLMELDQISLDDKASGRHCADQVLGPRPAQDECRLADALVGLGQRGHARRGARCVSALQCRCHRGHGTARIIDEVNRLEREELLPAL